MTLREEIATAAMAFAEAIVRAVEHQSETLNQHTSPIGKRQYLEAARRGDFPSTKAGKLVIVTREDWDIYMAKHRNMTRVQETGEGDAEQVAAEKLGLRKAKR